MKSMIIRATALLFAFCLLNAPAPAADSQADDSLTFYLQKAGNAYSRGELDGALKLYENALRFDAGSANALSNLGAIYYLKQDLQKSLAYLRKAQLADSSDAEIFNSLGVTYTALGDTTRAIDSYRRALTLKEEKVVAAKNLANLLLSRSRFTEANAAIRQALKFDTADAEIYFVAGNIHMATGDYMRCEPFFDRAVLLAPKNPRYFYYQGVAKDKLAKKFEAEMAYKKTIELYADHFDAHQHLGVLYIMDQKYPEAVAQFQESVRIKPESDEARIALGAAYMLNDMPDKAKEVYDHLNARNPEAAARMMKLVYPGGEE